NSDLGPTSEGPAGGGISARNAPLVQLEKTVVRNNTANGYAGGGVYFITTDEGPLPTILSVPSWDFDWNDFLWTIYQYDGAPLTIDHDSSFLDNRATTLSGQAADLGKGGAIYILRWKGLRKSGLMIPEEPGVTPPVLKGKLITVYIGDSDVLSLTNSASF